ncbi:hypothetical protein SEA_SCHOTTB_8 [Gordonia Phage SchottB]|nr:hypothetical protein SEA_SCHOTTB_8 [Gordonia Phage SchottB]
MSFTDSDLDLPTRDALIEAGVDLADAEVTFDDGTRAVWDDTTNSWQFAR